MKPSITKQANAEASTSWISILEIAKDAQTEQLTPIFLELRLALAHLTLRFSPGDVTLPTISWDQIFTVDPYSLLPPVPTLQLQLSSNSITDESLAAYIEPGETTDYREERRTIRGPRRYFDIVGPRDSHHYTTYVPYSVPVYSANIPALTSALSNTLTTHWVKEFEKELKVTITKLTQEVAENATKHINDKLAPPVSQLQLEVNRRQEVLQRSEEAVKQLEGWKRQLEEAKKAIKIALHETK